MSKDEKKRPDDVKSRRELLAATAKLSAFIGAMGLTGAGLSGGAEARPTAVEGTRMQKVRPRGSRRLLPAVQRRELKAVLQESLRTGNPGAALKRHPNLKLTRQQEASLMRISKQEWASLRSAQAKMASFKAMADGDTGYVFW